MRQNFGPDPDRKNEKALPRRGDRVINDDQLSDDLHA